MSLVATYQIGSPVYDSVFEEIPDLRFEVEQVLACSPETLSVTCWVETSHPAAFETHLEQWESGETTQYTDWEDDRALYQLWVPIAKTTYWDWTSLGGVLLDATVTPRGATIRMEFPDHESLSTYRKCCLDQDIDFSLSSLTEAHSDSKLNPQLLTSSQRRLVASAIEHGYFEIPRGISMVELAAAHDISDQAASERLRRGLSNLLKNGRFDTMWAPQEEENTLRAR
ncbi:helix-turn-helix domain-containing protein [Halococcus hamelinensis]|uniref:Bacterio-opsin activator HTH domain-containing protein n=1 Tax=Halococcus hamelinensis 100A6 TaxID=1132509 RepID=M0M8A4_9EURY|nr:helix-turn-helix domain-containing protein [Halococcus hamelinensis]EMA41961.1 bacterio-opsin activator HTH domain-containing protein [Halococcus hamelinensis 100A6]